MNKLEEARCLWKIIGRVSLEIMGPRISSLLPAGVKAQIMALRRFMKLSYRD